MKREEWILLAADCAENGSLSPIQLQKSLFLLSQKYPNEVGEGFYEFKPYNYGPFDKEIYSDCIVLAQQGFLIVQQPIGQSWTGYSVTRTGIEYAKRLEKKAFKDGREYLCQIVKWIQGLTFSELLTAIYNAFPEFKKDSVFQE